MRFRPFFSPADRRRRVAAATVSPPACRGPIPAPGLLGQLPQPQMVLTQLPRHLPHVRTQHLLQL